MKRLTEFVISLLLAGLIIYALFRHFDVRLTMESVRHARASALMLGAGLMAAAYLLRGARWRIWERSLTYWNSLRLILIGFMGNNVLPGRLGEVLRAHCAAAKIEAGRGRAAALGSIGAERILDGLVLGVFGLVAIALVPLSHRLDWVLLLPSLFFAVLTAALVLSFRHHNWIKSLIAAVNKKFPGRITAFTGDKATALLNGFLPLGTLPRMLGAVATTVAIWSLETGACYLFGHAVWSGMTVRAALLFLVVVNFASLIPLTMGGIGTVEAAGPLFLIASGVSAHFALAMVLLQHGTQYLLTTISGGFIYWIGGFHRIPIGNPKAPAAPRAAPSLSTAALDELRSGLRQDGVSGELTPSNRGEIQLSIVIPAFNEQARLPRTVRETLRWCVNRNVEFELIVVDDGSEDQTLALARSFEGDVRVHVLARSHMGKGAAVRAGALHAKGRVVLFMDADGATPLDEIPKLLAAIKEGYDVAIGSRVVQHPGEVAIETSLHRRFVGRAFATLVNLLAFEGIRDTQCGFKMFRRHAAAAIFSRQKLTGFAFDVEILFIARRLSFCIAEIPVNWVAQAGSKVSLVADSIKMLWDVSRIRWMHRRFDGRRSPGEGTQPARLALAGEGTAVAPIAEAMAAPVEVQAPHGADCLRDA
jgi:dolichyl-phosphate beta-glucosyltransferase